MKGKELRKNIFQAANRDKTTLEEEYILQIANQILSEYEFAFEVLGQ